MSTETGQMAVGGIRVQIIRKPIKNLHLGVYPPDGRVRVAAPLAVTDAAVRLAVIGKLAWIKRQRARFQGQARESAREFISGESHYFRGRRYRLCVVEHDRAGQVVLRNATTLELRVRPGTDRAGRQRVLHGWYRGHLRTVIPPLLARWEATLGVKAAGWGIKLMKTRWGACNVEARRIWLNLELAKKPVRCLEYILVHELVHLIERHHNDRFLAVMDQHLPQWRSYRQLLNSAPLGHADWTE